jgi:hypothetical protein
MLPILPVAIENAAETTYPVSEDVSVGVMFVGGNLTGVGFIFLMQWLIARPALGPPPFAPASIFFFGTDNTLRRSTSHTHVSLILSLTVSLSVATPSLTHSLTH